MSDFVQEFSMVIPAPQARIFEAMTQPRDLERWFAEHVDVIPAPGGNFRFWGKHTLGTPAGEDADQRIVAIEPGESLTFSWRLFDIPSEVTWQLSEAEDGTAMKVTHVFEAMPDQPRPEALIDDLWRLNVGNLAALLMGSEPLLPDFDDPDPVVRQSILIRAPRASVFAALTRPEHMRQWAGGENPEVDLKQGGRYSFGWQYEIEGETVEGGPTRVIEFEPDRKLVIDWPDWRGDSRVPTQQITWLLEDEGDGTRLTLIHSGFVRATDISDYPFGWLYFLDQIREVSVSIN